MEFRRCPPLITPTFSVPCPLSKRTPDGSRNDMARSRVTSCDFYIDAIYWQTSMYCHPFILDYSVTSRTILTSRGQLRSFPKKNVTHFAAVLIPFHRLMGLRYSGPRIDLKKYLYKRCHWGPNRLSSPREL